MTYGIVAYLTMFASNFFAVFLMGLQSKNVNAGRYLAAVLTSVGISISQFIFVKYVTAGSYDVFIVCATGACCGISFSIWFYKRFMERGRHVGK